MDYNETSCTLARFIIVREGLAYMVVKNKILPNMDNNVKDKSFIRRNEDYYEME